MRALNRRYTPNSGNRPRIGIDYRLALVKTRGMGRYIAYLVDTLKNRDDGMDFVLLCDRSPGVAFDPGRMKIDIVPMLNYIFFEQFAIPASAKRLALDAVWSPANTFPLFMPKSIYRFVTIHDLIFLMRGLGDSLTPKQRIGKIYRSLVCKMGARKPNVIFTDSCFSISEIKSKLGRDDAIYAPVMNEYQTSLKYSKSVLDEYSLKDGKYFFTVSGDAPSKNLLSVLIAHDLSDSGMPLVVSGVSNPRSIARFLSRCAENVIFTGYLSDEELFSLYKHAGCFLFLSLAEGFGIPILEAMSYNLPIIASNRTSIPEVIGNCGVLVDPLNVDEVARTMRTFKRSDFIEMIKHQPTQLEKFNSWTKTADIVVNAMKKVLYA